MSRYVRVAGADDVRPGRARAVAVEDRHVLLCNVEGSLYAVADVCTHDGGPLGEGRLRGSTIECPRHGARFDVRDGSVVALPAVRPLATYPVRIIDGGVEVALGGDEAR